MQLEIESDSRWAEILVGNLTTYQLSDLVRTALRDLEIRHSDGDRKKRDPALTSSGTPNSAQSESG